MKKSCLGCHRCRTYVRVGCPKGFKDAPFNKNVLSEDNDVSPVIKDDVKKNEKKTRIHIQSQNRRHPGRRLRGKDSLRTGINFCLKI